LPFYLSGSISISVFFLPSVFPIGLQFGAMQCQPLQHELISAIRQVARKHRAIVNRNERAILGLDDVKMRTVLVVVKHSNQNAIKAADGGHDDIVFALPSLWR